MRANESICKHYMSDLLTGALTIIDSMRSALTEYLSAGFLVV